MQHFIRANQSIAILAAALLCLPKNSFAEGAPTAAKVGYYVDSRDFNTIYLELSTGRLPFGLFLWGFTDFNADQDNPDARFDPTAHLSRYNLSYGLDPKWVKGIEGLGLQLEYFDLTGKVNNLLRWGPTYRHNLPKILGPEGWLLWRFFPVESDGSGSMAGLVFHVPITDRIFIDGFTDLHIDPSKAPIWVAEPQLNLKLSDQIALVLEFRYDGFLGPIPGLDAFGVAPGIHVVF